MPKQDNIRVHALATELGLTNKDVLAIAKKLGIAAKSHASPLTLRERKRIQKHFENRHPGLFAEGNVEALASLTRKQRRLKVSEAERSQQRKEHLEQRRQQQRAQAQKNREPATASAPRVVASNTPKLIGAALVEHCLKGLADGVAETSICIRAGYKVDDIGQFRRAFSKEAKVALAPLNRMAKERSMRLSAVKQAPSVEPEPTTSAVVDRLTRTVTTSARIRSAGFRAGVLARHGDRCVCCGMALPELLEAAHIVPVANNGSDSPSNGLPLCPTHHSAFDRHLFAINPDTLEIQLAEGLIAEMLQIQHRELKVGVSQEALQMRWDMFQAGKFGGLSN